MSAVALHCYDTGPWAGPGRVPVVLAGSLGTDHTMWLPQLAHLERRGWRALAPDTRGHGRSPCPRGPYSIDDLASDLLKLLDDRSVRTAVLVGISLGAMASLRLAAKEPHRVASLTLMATSAYLPPGQQWLDRAQTVRRAGIVALGDGVRERWFTPEFAESNLDTISHFQERLASTPAEGYAGCCEAIGRMDLRPDLARIEAPCLVIAGSRDPGTPPARLAEIADGVVDATYYEVQAAHLLSWERHKEVNDLLVHQLENSL